jgi:adenylate cyclase class 2
MNEIEVKAKLKDKEGVMNILKEMGLEIHASKYQKDTIYWPNDIKDPSGRLEGRNFIRIREQKIGNDKKVIFTIKQSLKNQLDSVEHEIEVKEEDIPTMLEMFKLLGFYHFTTVEKERINANIGDIEVCIDEVTDLGSFIELEKMLEKLGIKKEDYVYFGYDILMYNKLNNL